MRGTTKLCQKHPGFRKENRRQICFSRHYQAGTITIGKSGDQNSGRNGEDGRQDPQMVDIDVPPTKLQKDQSQCQRTNQNNGCVHLLHPVQTDHRHKGITDRLCHQFQMSNDAIQETDNREETAWWTRQIKQGERRIQQKPGRSRQNRRTYTCQENKKSKQISNSSKINTQR